MSSASERPLPFRLRPELEIRPIRYQQRRCWVIRDPVALTHSFASDEEHTLLQMLDGHSSSERLQQQYARRFAPRRLGAAQLQSFLVRLQRQGLLLSLLPSAAATQLRRIGQRGAWWQRPAQWLAIRMPLVNPDPALRRIAPLVRWLFRLPSAVAVLLSAVAVLMVVAAPGHLVRTGVAEVQLMLAGHHLLVFAAAMLLVRIVHELGHGIACRLAGRPCHEMGVTLLFGIPVMYCDVSAAWTLGSKWRRMAISAAGIYVELLIATLCLALWWFSNPGLFHSLCLHIVLICSVGTVLLNGNPLMRYDGYYLLADWLEIPNLDQVGRAALKRRLWSFFLGISLGREHLVDERRERLCAVYALMAGLYRFAVLLAVLACFYYALRPYRLEPLVVIFGLLLAASLAGERLRRTLHELRVWHSLRQLRWKRLVVRSTALLGAVAALLAVPLPHHVRAPALLEPADRQHLYVTAAGRIVRAVRPGQFVDANAVVLQLENPELEQVQLELATERDRLEQRLQALEVRRGTDPRAAAEIPATRQARDDFTRRWQRAEADLSRLTLRADRAGVVLRPAAQEAEPASDESLGSWTGTPLDATNGGAWLEPGTLVATVVPRGPLVAVAIVEQSDLDALAVGQSVHLRALSAPHPVRQGTIVEIARRPLDEVPSPLAATGDVLTKNGPAANVPLVPSYQIRIALEGPTGDLLPNHRARCRILVTPRSCGQRLYHFLRRTFSQS